MPLFAPGKSALRAKLQQLKRLRATTTRPWTFNQMLAEGAELPRLLTRLWHASPEFQALTWEQQKAAKSDEWMPGCVAVERYTRAANACVREGFLSRAAADKAIADLQQFREDGCLNNWGFPDDCAEALGQCIADYCNGN